MRIFKEKTIKNDFLNYRPIPFWSWNNVLDKKELVKQIREMKDAGLGGFIMHARTGLKTEYLSDEWFKCVDVCLKEAKKLHMKAYMYDENGWPSGFAGGKLLKDKENLARYLTLEYKKQFDKKAYCVFIKENDAFKRVKNEEKYENYYNIYLKSSPANTDILNPLVVDRFIECTYEEYYKRFKKSFGNEFVGFFTDEPQYFRWGTPYSPMVAKEWQGGEEDLKDGLIYLFYNNREGWPFRDKYYKILNRLYTENYYKKIFDWCTLHNVCLTGHSIEENSLYAQMWGCAGVMPSYEYQHIPGIDFLGRVMASPLAAKQVGSVSSQLGKKQILSETFGCSGWDTTPIELRFLAETQYVYGVNLMCLHLMNYSLQSQGKLDHPPSFSKHMTWWNKEFKVFNDFFAHLGALLCETEEVVGSLIISPLHGIYAKYIRNNEEETIKLSREFDAFLYELQNKHISYHIADEILLKKYAKIGKGNIKIGKCVYKSIILPECITLDSSTKELLEKFSKSGGKIFTLWNLPKYFDGVKGRINITSYSDWNVLKSFEPVIFEASGPLMTTYRKGKDYDVFYALNAKKSDVDLKVPEGFEYLLDVSNLTVKKIPENIVVKKQESVVLLRFYSEYDKSYCLKISNNHDDLSFQSVAANISLDEDEKDITDIFTLVCNSPNNLTIDYAQISKKGAPFEESKFVYRIKEELIREDYQGELFAKYEFFCDVVLPLKVRFEKGEWINITCNNIKLNPVLSDFDIYFYEADLPFVKKGKNEIIFQLNYYQPPEVKYALFDPDATESLKNCLAYNSETESIYILGDFSLTDERHIVKPKAFKGLANISSNGYSMFFGEMVFEGNLFFEKETARLSAKGRFMAVNIEVDEKPAGDIILYDTIDIKATAGQYHKIRLTLKSSLRNVFGPFHLQECEPMAVSPVSFTFLGSWKEKNNGFYEGYHIVPFGIEKLTVKFI